MKMIEITGCKEKAALLPSVDEINNKAPEVCPVDWALNVVKIARREGCGKTVMCRDGIWQILINLEAAVSGGGNGDDLELIKDLLGPISVTGCELAAGAADLVLRSIELYSDEWDLHIKRKRCTELQCKSYYTVYADPAAATGDEDAAVCPEAAIAGGAGMIPVVNDSKCTRCLACVEKYPEVFKKAGAVKPKLPEAPIPVGTFEGAAEGGRRRRRGN